MQNSMLKNILDVCGAAIGFYTIGYALAFGDKEEETGFTFAGTTGFFTASDNIDPAFWFFEFCFAASAATSEWLDNACLAAAFMVSFRPPHERLSSSSKLWRELSPSAASCLLTFLIAYF